MYNFWINYSLKSFWYMLKFWISMCKENEKNYLGTNIIVPKILQKEMVFNSSIENKLRNSKSSK